MTGRSVCRPSRTQQYHFELKVQQLKKKLFILFWISLRFLVRSNLTTGTCTDQGERSVNRELLEMPSNSIPAA